MTHGRAWLVGTHEQPMQSRARAAVGACAPRDVPLRPGAGPPRRGRHVEDAPYPRAASQCASNRIKPHVATQVAWTTRGRTYNNVSTLTRRPGVDSTRAAYSLSHDIRRAHCVTHATCRLSRMSISVISRAPPACAVSRTDGTSRRVHVSRTSRVTHAFKHQVR
jgi:hypothetical protein